jgi:hypothetical protein
MTAGPTTAPLEIVSRRIRAAGVETHPLEDGSDLLLESLFPIDETTAEFVREPAG